MPKQGPTLASGRAAATGATAYTERARQLAEPLVPLGVASIVLMAPYNGTRSPRGQLAHYIDNVADYMLQSLAITLEGAALVRTLDQGFDGPRRDGLRYDDRLTPCVAGLSWGGAMAACAALVSQAPCACMVGLGSDSPRVMATGALHWQLDWAALAAERRTDLQQTRGDIIATFTRITFATVLARAPRRQSVASVVQVGARDDRYVSADESRQLFASLQRAVPPRARCVLRWVDGGHATAFLRQRALFVPAIMEAIDAAEDTRLAAEPAKPTRARPAARAHEASRSAPSSTLHKTTRLLAALVVLTLLAACCCSASSVDE